MSSELRELMLVHIEEWRQSGMSREAYAQKMGVTRYKFEYWVRKLSRSEAKVGDGHRFVQLRPTGGASPVPDKNAGGAGKPQPQIELTFPGGACLKIYL